MAFSRCALVLTGKPVVPRITSNGDNAALVTIDGYSDFVGMVMPFRFPKESKPADISWFRTVRLSVPGDGSCQSTQCSSPLR